MLKIVFYYKISLNIPFEIRYKTRTRRQVLPFQLKEFFPRFLSFLEGVVNVPYFIPRSAYPTGKIHTENSHAQNFYNEH